MYVFVANYTQQHRHFHYRVPESQALRQVEIRPGAQAQLSEDLNDTSLAAIIEQLERAGAVPSTDPKALTTAFGLIYTVGKPIPSKHIDAARERDVVVRQEIAGDKVMEAGEALHAVASSGAPGKVESSTLEVTQMTDRDEGATAVKGGVDAQVMVSRSAPQQRGRQSTRRRG